MASPGTLLCAVGLLLCWAANLGLFAALVPNSKKPIIGKEAGGARGRGGCRLQRVPPAWEKANCKVRSCAVLYSRRGEPRRYLDRAEI